MAGMGGIRTGLNGSVVGGLYGGYGSGAPGSAAAPPASGIPEGPVSITQQAWGVPPAQGASMGNIGLRTASISTIALVVLGIIWWTLPR